MGFKPPKTIYKLDFSETEYAGLEVTVRAGSIEKLTVLQRLSEEAGMITDSAEKMFAEFAALLVSWNVEDDEDRPVPTTYEGVASQEPVFIQAVIQAWQANITAAPPPLPGVSDSGGTSAEESTLGLASASRSLRS